MSFTDELQRVRLKRNVFVVLCCVAGASSGVNPGIYKQENPLGPREPPARNDDGKLFFTCFYLCIMITIAIAITTLNSLYICKYLNNFLCKFCDILFQYTVYKFRPPDHPVISDRIFSDI